MLVPVTILVRARRRHALNDHVQTRNTCKQIKQQLKKHVVSFSLLNVS